MIDGELRVFFDESQPIPPLVSKELVLADSPDSIEGSTVEPQNGENCIGECRYIQPGLAPCITDEDLGGGSLYLNLVAFAARESSFAKGSQPVAVRGGGHLRAQQYDASLAPGCE